MTAPPFLTRLFHRPRIHGRENIPRDGGCFLFAPRRSPLDLYIISRSVSRTVIFPDSREEAVRRAKEGCMVCLFPEGETGWYGETSCDPEIFRTAEQTGLPVIIVSLRGIYDLFPPFAERPTWGRPAVFLNALLPGEAETAFFGVLEEERLFDITTRQKHAPLDARNIEEILYICPDCGELFTLRGEKSGRVRCRACRGSWTFLRGKGLKDNTGGKVLPLGYLGDLAVRSLTQIRTKRMQFPVSLGENPGLFIISDDHILLAGDGREPSAFVFSYNDVESVYIPGRDRLSLSCRQGDSKMSFMIQPPLYACLFLAHVIRIRAFGNVDAKNKG